MKRSGMARIVPILTALLSIAIVASRVHAGSEEETARLLEVLRSDAGVFEKAKACQRLAVVGTGEAVPVLAEMLGDEKLAHYARSGLEPMPYASVDDVLRSALGRLDGTLRIGVINSIGARRDTGAQEALLPLLRSSDRELASAAAAALGRIGTLAGADGLRAALADRSSELGIRLGEAAIVCAEELGAAGELDAALRTFSSVRQSPLPAHVRAAALRGEILLRGDDGIPLLLEAIRGDDVVLARIAFGVARELPGKRVTAALVKALAELPAPKQSQTLAALADRGDRSALPAVLARLGEGDAPDSTRVAAIRALAKLGDASAVPRLVLAATGDDEEGREVSAASLATLAEMGGDDVDGAALALFDIALRQGRGERGAAFLRVLVEVVGLRKIPAAVRLLREAADRDDEAVRRAAIRSLGTTIGLDDFEALVERLDTSRGDDETAAIRDALGMASRRMPGPAECTRALAAAMEGATESSRATLLGVFSSVGGPEALELVVANALAPDTAVRQAALAALGAWSDESAVLKLLEITPKLDTTEDRSAAYIAFRDLVRRVGFDVERRIGACVDAMRLARTDEERRRTIEALEGVPAPPTLELLATSLDDDALCEHAASAMVTIGERLIRTAQRGAVGPAMEKVLAATKDAEIRQRAERLAKQASGR